MENTKLRMAKERVDYLDRVLIVKAQLLDRAVKSGSKEVIERVKIETRLVEQELKDTLEVLEDLKYEHLENNVIFENELLDQQDLLQN